MQEKGEALTAIIAFLPRWICTIITFGKAALGELTGAGLFFSIRLLYFYTDIFIGRRLTSIER